jgi:hypothetical protein
MHTPLYADGNRIYEDRGEYRGDRVAECPSSTHAAEDAEFIVRACNSHADLLEALRDLMWRFEDDDTDPHATKESAPDILAARAAIAKAGK